MKTSSNKLKSTHSSSILCGTILTLTLCLAAILSSHIVSAEGGNTNTDIVDQINITVPVSCTMSGTGQNTHNAEINNGQYNSNIGTTTLKAFCNDNEGFSIYAVGYTNNEIGKNVLTSSTLGPTHDIVTGTEISGNTSNWAMKLATVSDPTPTYPIIIMGSTDDTEKQVGDPDYSTFQNVPSSYTKVVKRESSTDVGTTAEGATLTTTYQAYISPTQAAGTYTGQVKYTMVHPASSHPLKYDCEPDKICYAPNGDNVVGTMGIQDKDDVGNDLADGASVILYASNFSRAGYGFAGWTNKYDYATNTDSDLKFYGPQETITVPEGTAANGLSLYAVWVKSTGSLQDSTKVATLCGTGTGSLTQAPTDGTANLSSVSALTDQRDNQTYAIAKLADGKCWMIENLRLDNQYTVGNNQTDPSVTNASLSQGYNPSFIGLAEPESANFSNTTTANSLYSIDGSTASTISGSNQGYRFPRYNNDNTSQRAANTTNTDVNTYSYGNYYTWAAVIADTTNYTVNNQNVTATSICPTGWTLPRGGNKSNEANSDYWNLIVNGINNGTKPANYGSSNQPYYTGDPEGTNASKLLRAYPNNFLYSGVFDSSSTLNRGSRGSYWSSTARSASDSYYLSLYSTSVFPGTPGYYKYRGYSARCVAGQ
ncbi:hypothetical protein IKF04_04475 [Candidatus Saccharibacteria bacterium]|nr:hypothetical protein [Candidatus Saccharibacteria bacterium]